jgi:hypothetical protein
MSYELTLTLHYFTKWAEVFFTITWFVLTTINGVKFAEMLNIAERTGPGYLVYVAIVLLGFHVVN